VIDQQWTGERDRDNGNNSDLVGRKLWGNEDEAGE
jgi:hypothetical protein